MDRLKGVSTSLLLATTWIAAGIHNKTMIRQMVVNCEYLQISITKWIGRFGKRSSKQSGGNWSCLLTDRWFESGIGNDVCLGLLSVKYSLSTIFPTSVCLFLRCAFVLLIFKTPMTYFEIYCVRYIEQKQLVPKSYWKVIGLFISLLALWWSWCKTQKPTYRLVPLL